MAENHPVVSVWHEIVASRDMSKLNEWLDDEVVFFSPVVHRPQHGKLLTSMYLAAAAEAFGNPTFRYSLEIIGETQAMLEFEVEIDGIFVNGVDLLKWNAAGKVTEFKVMLRPLKAIQLMHQKMAEALGMKV